MLKMQRVQALAGLVVTLALTAACGDSTTKEEYFASAEAFAKEGKYPGGDRPVPQRRRQDPQYGEARFKLAEAYVKTNDLPRAMGEYIRAADLMPEQHRGAGAGGALPAAGPPVRGRQDPGRNGAGPRRRTTSTPRLPRRRRWPA